MRPRIVMLLAFVIAAVAVGFTGARFTLLPSPHGPVHQTLPSVSDSYLGVFEPGSPPSYQPIAEFANAAGTTPNLIGYYLDDFFRFGDKPGIARINVDEFGKRFAEQGSHHAIGFGKHFRNDRFLGTNRPQHIHVLRTLPGVEESNLGSRSLAAENSLRAQSLPDCRLIRG